MFIVSLMSLNYDHLLRHPFCKVHPTTLADPIMNQNECPYM